MKLDEATCPECGAGPGVLSIKITLVAKPLGSHSLSGAQMKVSANEVPILVCRECDLALAGWFDGDRAHVAFPKPPEA